MKNIILFFALAFCSAAFAQIDSVRLNDGEAIAISNPAKVLQIQALSSVADGTANVKLERELLAKRDVEIVTAITNTFFTLVWSNGTEVVTNSVTREADILPLPGPRALISYETNNVITTTYTTNVETYVALVVTNAIGNVTCEDGYGSTDASNKFLLGGGKLFFDGTAKGDVFIIIEK